MPHMTTFAEQACGPCFKHRIGVILGKPLDGLIVL